MTQIIEVEVNVQQNVVETVIVKGIKGDKGGAGTGLAVITLTQVAYDALSQPEKDDSTIWYVISDA